MQSTLLPQELRKKLPPLYSTEKEADPTVYCKFFHPLSNWTWYVLEFDGDDIFFGYVVGFEKEPGYFSLSEMESIKIPPGIERDLCFQPCKLSEIYKLHDQE